MSRRLPRKPRGLCPLALTGVACCAFGREGCCPLCDMIDMEHPTTCVTLGRYPPQDAAQARERAFWAHLARRTDGGPVTPAELAAKLARKRGARAPEVFRAAARDAITRSTLPVEPPF